jgi:hypothetical protein
MQHSQVKSESQTKNKSAPETCPEIASAKQSITHEIQKKRQPSSPILRKQSVNFFAKDCWDDMQ